MDQKQTDYIYSLRVKFGQCFVVHVSHHLVEFSDYFGNRIGIVRHSLVVTPLQTSFKTSQQIIQRIWIVFVIQFCLLVGLSEDIDADVIFFAVQQNLDGVFDIIRREYAIYENALVG